MGERKREKGRKRHKKMQRGREAGGGDCDELIEGESERVR